MYPLRKIIHVDMDAFFASVEQRDNPELQGKPVAVGGGGKRGVVASASYEARKFGVRSAMPGFKAVKLCPEIIFVRSRFEVYKTVSQQIRQIFLEYTDLVEPLSLDEAYLDVTSNKMEIPSATLIATEIRKKIFDTTKLTASAGVSFNKFLAKVASGVNKPNGIKVITPEQAPRFLEELAIERFHGIGKKTAQKMMALGIHNGAELKKWPEEELVKRFGKSGGYYYRIVRAEEDRPVNPNRIRKSIGAERTYSEDLTDIAEMKVKLEYLAGVVYEYMAKHQNFGRTVTLKAKTPDFKTITRSKSFATEVRTLKDLIIVIFELLESNVEQISVVRLLGVTISTLEREKQQQGAGIQLTLDL